MGRNVLNVPKELVTVS